MDKVKKKYKPNINLIDFYANHNLKNLNIALLNNGYINISTNNSEPLSIMGISNTRYGKIKFISNNTWNYIPNKKSGIEIFNITLIDNSGNTFKEEIKINLSFLKIIEESKNKSNTKQESKINLTCSLDKDNSVLIKSKDLSNLSITDISGESFGQLINNYDETWTYFPNKNFKTRDKLTFTTIDKNGDINTKSFYLYINNKNNIESDNLNITFNNKSKLINIPKTVDNKIITNKYKKDTSIINSNKNFDKVFTNNIRTDNQNVNSKNKNDATINSNNLDKKYININNKTKNDYNNYSCFIEKKNTSALNINRNNTLSNKNSLDLNKDFNSHLYTIKTIEDLSILSFDDIEYIQW